MKRFMKRSDSSTTLLQVPCLVVRRNAQRTTVEPQYLRGTVISVLNVEKRRGIKGAQGENYVGSRVLASDERTSVALLWPFRLLQCERYA